MIASYPKTGTTLKSTAATDLPTGLPTVAGEPGAEPTITVPPGTTPPKARRSTVLAKGTGPAVAKGKLADRRVHRGQLGRQGARRET